jgi:hypothetical protein
LWYVAGFVTLEPGSVNDVGVKAKLIAEPSSEPTVALSPAWAEVLGEIAIKFVSGAENAEEGDKIEFVMFGPATPQTSLAKPAYHVVPIAG